MTRIITGADSAELATLAQAWQILQATPAYVERIRDGRSSWENEEGTHVLGFCACCGFQVEEQHECPPAPGA